VITSLTVVQGTGEFVTTVTRVSDARTRCTAAELNVRVYTASSVVHLQAGKREMIASVSSMSYKSSAVAEMGDRARAKRAEKLGAAVHLSAGELSSNTVWPGPRPTYISSGILIHPTVWPRYTNVKDRQTDNAPIAYRATSFINGRPRTTA